MASTERGAFMGRKNKNRGNYSSSNEIPYKPLPEITPPGTVGDPGEELSALPSDGGLMGSPYGGIDDDDAERMRGWDRQNKL
jgi:hypothetical protein